MISNFDPISLALFLAGLGLLPFLLIATTSFLKISMVLMITRNAIGVQQVPPSMAIYGMAMMLTVYVMAPTFQVMAQQINEQKSQAASQRGIENFAKTVEPLRVFMLKHAKEDQRDRFLDKARKLWPQEQAEAATSKDFVILVPAFMVSEIQAGFEMGFLIFIPFVVIDLIVSNLLLALGMQMVSPMTVSLPIKMFVFVLIDGWGRLLDALLNTYL